MNWWQAIILGLVQGLTEFLPVSSSGHLVIFSKLLGVDGEGFLDFTVTVHLATVIATIVVFWKVIWDLLKGLFKFKYNDETDYILKILVSLIPVMLVGFLLKDWVEGLFSGSLHQVGFALCATAALLILSDYIGKSSSCHFDQAERVEKFPRRNGISWWQAFVVGIAQAIAVIPGVSRSGSTIATGLLCGVERKGMAQFSFLMVLIPILGEQFLDLLKVATGSGTFGAGVGPLALVLGFVAAFASGLFACKVMIAIVKKAKLTWFAAYCLVVAALIFFLS
ncbi:MAG: undecaprenyl-diphosphate phosphatase [Bacteroidales bacterium]|nr:undecaprenyl-diphosphate phosphatase [Bacteroidales bacterium]